MKTSKDEILQMMQEEFNNMQEEAPISEVTRSEIEKMMEEEYSKMQDADPSVVEARKHPLKRDREAFTRNQDMVSGLQKTITNYLKETGLKIKPRHAAAVERMSTRLMHVANSPMIRLEEGNIHYDGLMENIEDILKDELERWHPEAKVSLKREVESQGFDLSQKILALIAAPL